MATYVATSDIKWGKDTDNVKVFHDGDTVTGPSEDEMTALVDAGAVVLKSDYKKNRPSEQDEAEADELRQRNEELQSELEMLRAKLADAESKQAPAAWEQPAAPTK